MADLQGLVHFPGIQRVVRASFTISHGITPSSARLEIVPQTNLVSDGGTLTFTFGPVRLVFADCRINSASLKRRESGLIWSLEILDRRWKWRFGEISGRYNIRRADGLLIPLFERTPQQLAGLLLTAMNESGFSVGELPNQTRPHVSWDAANPAAELAALCEALGCRVVLGIDNRVSIRRLGIGQVLPQRSRMIEAFGVDPPPRPDSIKILGGAIRFQSKLQLEAVGLDNDGLVKPIDDLSYRPQAGWECESPSVFQNVADEKDRALALASVFRWYRVNGQADGSMVVPGYGGRVTFIEQLLPLDDALIESYVGADGELRRRPALVEGVYARSGDPPGFFNSTETTRFEGTFRIDGRAGLVKFREPVYRFDSNNEHLPALLLLTTSYRVLNGETRQQVRPALERTLPGRQHGTGPRIVRRSDLVGIAIAAYDDRNRLSAVATNIEEFNRRATSQLDAIEAEYGPHQAMEMEYAGLLPIAPDGAIQQVTWTIGPDGARTRAGRNSEFTPVVRGGPN